jgi:hypothetical protein
LGRVSPNLVSLILSWLGWGWRFRWRLGLIMSRFPACRIPLGTAGIMSRFPARLVPLGTAGIESGLLARRIPLGTAGIMSRFPARLVPLGTAGIVSCLLARVVRQAGDELFEIHGCASRLVHGS